MKKVIVLFFLLAISLQARTWTSVNGRKIEADMVRPDGEQVVVSMGGKEISIPRSKLSKEDLDFVDGWKPPELTLGGVVIVKGGKVNVIERDYSPEALKRSSRTKAALLVTSRRSPKRARSREKPNGSWRLLSRPILTP